MIDSEERLIRTREAAEMLGVSPSRVAGWRNEGYGPPYMKLQPEKKNSAVRYPLSKLIEWRDSLTLIIPQVAANAEAAHERL